MKNATLILAAACVLSSCVGSRGTSKTTRSKDNTVFSWLSSTAAPHSVSR